MTTELDEMMEGLPGADLVREGVSDLVAGRETVASLVIAIGHPRLSSLGIAAGLAEHLPVDPEIRLYQLLCSTHGNEAHSQYNALIRRLVSFERSLERRVYASVQGGFTGS